MYRIFKNNSGCFIEVKDSQTPEGICNVIPLVGEPNPTPADFEYAADGSSWITIQLAEAITGGIYRYTPNKDRPTGYFFTNILCSSAEEAQRRLQLPSGNTADYKHRAKISPTTVQVSYIPGTTDVQLYVADTGNVKFYGSTATEAAWNEIDDV